MRVGEIQQFCRVGEDGADRDDSSIYLHGRIIAS